MNTKILRTLVCVVALGAFSASALSVSAEEFSASAEKKAESKGSKTTAECNQKSSTTITGTFLESTDDSVVIEVTVIGTSEQGVPLLTKIPYVTRLFKNVGVGQEKHKAVIRIPKSQITCTSKECSAKKTASRPYGKISAALTPPPKSGNGIVIHASTPALSLPGILGSGAFLCKERPLSKVAYPSTATTTCPVGKHLASASCKCGTSCGCGTTANAHFAKLHEQLVKALTENAHLEARVDAQRELAEQKERFLHELVEAKVEVVKLQTRVELANQQMAHQNHAHQTYTQSHHHVKAPVHHPVNVTERLRAENQALKAKIAELSKRLSTNSDVPHVSTKRIGEAKPSSR